MYMSLPGSREYWYAGRILQTVWQGMAARGIIFLIDRKNTHPMKKTILIMLSATAITLFAACGNSEKHEDSKEVAKEQNETKFDDTNIEDDTKFAVSAADGSMLEVELGKLAQTNGSAPQVKDLGKMMVDDHSKAGDELKALAQQKNISLPAAMSEDKREKYDDLAAKKGKDFDQAYTDFMVSEHKDVIDAFQKEADKGNDADIKAWAAGKVAALQHHLEMAQAAKDAVK
jgi:putative membrane protein